MGKGFVLLAEDNRVFARLFVDALRESGIDNEVVVVHDGREVLDYLFGTGEHEGRDTTIAPGLVVLDVYMPRLNGLETLRHIRADERTRRLPVVLFSAIASPYDITEAYRLGANSFIDKGSLGIMAYPDLISLMVRYWLYLNEALPPPSSGHEEGLY